METMNNEITRLNTILKNKNEEISNYERELAGLNDINNQLKLKLQQLT
jgi:hypothetical protein